MSASGEPLEAFSAAAAIELLVTPASAGTGRRGQGMGGLVPFHDLRPSGQVRTQREALEENDFLF